MKKLFITAGVALVTAVSFASFTATNNTKPAASLHETTTMAAKAAFEKVQTAPRADIGQADGGSY